MYAVVLVPAPSDSLKPNTLLYKVFNTCSLVGARLHSCGQTSRGFEHANAYYELFLWGSASRDVRSIGPSYCCWDPFSCVSKICIEDFSLRGMRIFQKNYEIMFLSKIYLLIFLKKVPFRGTWWKFGVKQIGSLCPHLMISLRTAWNLAQTLNYFSGGSY